ncbi:MAG: hypothetical protein ACM3VS_15480 [Candidatus Dadabacteria bacterium]
MARVFNLLLNHKGTSFTALLTVRGDTQETSKVRVNTSEEKIQILLPTGTLSFSIPEVIKHLIPTEKSVNEKGVLHITNTISLQLLQDNF